MCRVPITNILKRINYSKRNVRQYTYSQQILKFWTVIVHKFLYEQLKFEKRPINTTLNCDIRSESFSECNDLSGAFEFTTIITQH